MTAIAMPASIPNPLREGLAAERLSPEPRDHGIFGATGDLASANWCRGFQPFERILLRAVLP